MTNSITADAFCNTAPNNQDLGFGVMPNDNFVDAFSTLAFRDRTAFDYSLVYNPASPQPYVTKAKYGNDNRPIGVDMTQMNYVRQRGGAPQVSDCAAIF